MYIETQSLFIRDFTMDDVKDLHDILGDAEVMKNCEPAYNFEKTSNIRFNIQGVTIQAVTPLFYVYANDSPRI